MARPPGHFHPDLWSKADQHRYEDQVKSELKEIKGSVDKLTQRVTALMGAIGLLIFLIPIAAPFIRGALGLP